MLATGHSKRLAKGAAKAHDRRQPDEWMHYEDLHPARGIIVATLLSVGAWMLAWAFIFGH